MDEGSPIDEQQIRGMALAGGVDQEIADAIGCTEANLIERFGPLLKQARAKRRIQLRNNQTKVALDGNVAMLIFLGKFELGQNDQGGDPDDPQPVLDPKVG